MALRVRPDMLLGIMDSLLSNKPLIGMLHLHPLAGSVNYARTGPKPIIDAALRDLYALESGGVDAVFIENLGDVPYAKTAPVETIAMMTTIVHTLIERAHIPIGVNVLRNDGLAALAIAAATGARFVRVNVFCGSAFTDQGLIEGQARELHRLRRDLGTQTLILADVHVKHAAHLTSLEEAALDADRNLPDALIVSGIGTGRRTSPEDLQTVKQVSCLPVFIGSGVRIDNMATYREADGFIVGTVLKEGGRVDAPVDVKRVKAMADAVASLRRSE
ncbi:BtpA/SgcQ family protein [Candidatus Bipolaricaulota bacterium]|nr:BtpA/SgcQ family protein [Candidatus Bipolaricaulota bacterium]